MLIVGLVTLVVTRKSPSQGSQLYAESILKDFSAPAHPPATRLGEVGSAAFEADLNAATTPWDHFFSRSVGSGHMSLAMRADYREHLTQISKDCGFKYLRGHGLLDDDMSISKGPGQTAFYNLDNFVEFVLSIGMRPILELSFMPSWLAQIPCESGANNKGLAAPHCACHYNGNTSPPTSYEAWGDLIHALAAHLVERFGLDTVSSFYFEVWNEPDDQFWAGNITEYLKLYQHAAWGIKNVSSRLRVGGPAGHCPECSVWELISFSNVTGTALDFVSSHAYATCAMSLLGDPVSVTKRIFALRQRLSQLGIDQNQMELLITEWGASCDQGFGHDNAMNAGYHDMIDQASFTMASVDILANGRDGSRGPTDVRQPQALSYWAFSDIFEESFFPIANESFHGMFGLMNLHKVPKPTYRAYQLLHDTGDTRITVRPSVIESASAEDGLCAQTTGVIAVKNASTNLDLIVYNHAAAEGSGVSSAITPCAVSVRVRGFGGPEPEPEMVPATVRRIDEQHANPLRTWQLMGAPNYTTPGQNELLLEESALTPEIMLLQKTSDGSLTFTITVPPHGVAALKVSF